MSFCFGKTTISIAFITQQKQGTVSWKKAEMFKEILAPEENVLITWLNRARKIVLIEQDKNGYPWTMENPSQEHKNCVNLWVIQMYLLHLEEQLS